jgi:hypothetical protein
VATDEGSDATRITDAVKTSAYVCRDYMEESWLILIEAALAWSQSNHDILN